MAFPLKQTTDSLGDVDLQQLTLDVGAGTRRGEAEGRPRPRWSRPSTSCCRSCPLYERFGNNPILENVRVTNWPKDDDPIFANSAYADSYVIMKMLEGVLQPK